MKLDCVYNGNGRYFLTFLIGKHHTLLDCKKLSEKINIEHNIFIEYLQLYNASYKLDKYSNEKFYYFISEKDKDDFIDQINVLITLEK